MILTWDRVAEIVPVGEDITSPMESKVAVAWEGWSWQYKRPSAANTSQSPRQHNTVKTVGNCGNKIHMTSTYVTIFLKFTKKNDKKVNYQITINSFLGFWLSFVSALKI